ncbi:MAG: hypothetical protein KC983_10485, partial [Phycisphaerales bacterium]|nr:hypothetical protein [Phycisphaerales bacterium]
QPIAETLAALECIRGMVVHSDDGLDELTITATNTIAHVENGTIRMERLSPEDLGLDRVERENVVAQDLAHAVQIVRDVVAPNAGGPFHQMTLLTTAATLVVAGIARDMQDGVERASQSITGGHAANALETLCRVSNT